MTITSYQKTETCVRACVRARVFISEFDYLMLNQEEVAFWVTIQYLSLYNELKMPIAAESYIIFVITWIPDFSSINFENIFNKEDIP